MKKYLLIEKEKYGNNWEIEEFNTLEEIIENCEGNLKNKIIVKPMKLKYSIEEIEAEQKATLDVKEGDTDPE